MKKWQKIILVISVLSVLFVTMIVPSFALGNNNDTGSGGPNLTGTVESSIKDFRLVYDWESQESDTVIPGWYYFDVPVSDISPNINPDVPFETFSGSISSVAGDYFEDVYYGGNDITVYFEENQFNDTYCSRVYTYYTLDSEVYNYDSGVEIFPYLKLESEPLVFNLYTSPVDGTDWIAGIPELECNVYSDGFTRSYRTYEIRFTSMREEFTKGDLDKTVYTDVSDKFYLTSMGYADEVTLNGEWHDALNYTPVTFSLRYNVGGSWVSQTIPADSALDLESAIFYIRDSVLPADSPYRDSMSVLCSAEYEFRCEEPINTFTLVQYAYDRILFPSYIARDLPVTYIHNTAEVSPFRWIIEAGQTALSFEIIPGFEIGDILLIALAVPILLAVLRAIAGG